MTRKRTTRTSPARDTSTDQAQPTGRRTDAVPSWLQATAAVAGVVLSALVVFGIVREPPAQPDTLPTVTPATTVAAGNEPQTRVTIESIVTAPTEVSASGSFHDLAIGRHTVMLIGQPIDDADAEWLPVLASLYPDDGTATGPQSGRWEAVRRAVVGSYRWFAVVAPYAPGAQDPFVELRLNGPLADVVVARSEPLTSD